jgi:hypothetical protein
MEGLMTEFEYIKTIAFDLDGTLINWNKYWHNKGREVFGKNPVDPGAYELRDTFALSKEEETWAYKTFGSDYEINGEPFPYITNIFKYLEKKSINYMVISNRMPKTESSANAEKWFTKNILAELETANHFTGYIFNPSDTLKGLICKENNVDIIVEDAPYQIIDASRYIPVIKNVAGYNMDIIGDRIYPIWDYRNFSKLLRTIEEKEMVD